MKISVIGASGGSGQAAVRALLSEGHEVTAFARNPEGIAIESSRLQRVAGSALELEALEPAIRGRDVVVVTLGITENPLLVRLFGPKRTSLHVRSTGTQNVVRQMQKHGVRRLVVQTSFGVGDTRNRLGFFDGLFFALVLRPQIADTEVQEELVRKSGLVWTLVQPVHLNNANTDELPFVSGDGEIRRPSVSRHSVGRFLAQAATATDFALRSVALSGLPAAQSARRLGVVHPT
jgi:putative NADH-flavin reductase